MEENLDRLEEALGRLEEVNLKLKPSKCKLLQQEVLFLGHIVSADGVRPNPKLVESIRSWEPPKDRRGVQQCLGLCNYYRRFVPDFSVVANPLTDLTSKSKEFEWTASVHQAFEKLKVALSSASVLLFPLPSGDYILDTDASDVGVGGVLSQDQNGVERVIALSSKKLNKQQRWYCITRRELLAVVTFLREFCVHLLASEFTIRTDHSFLTWLPITVPWLGYCGSKSPKDSSPDSWNIYSNSSSGSSTALGKSMEMLMHCPGLQPCMRKVDAGSTKLV